MWVALKVTPRCKHHTKDWFGPVVCCSFAAQLDLLSVEVTNTHHILGWSFSLCPLQGSELWRCKRREEGPVLPVLGHLLRAANCSFNPFKVTDELYFYDYSKIQTKTPEDTLGVSQYGKCPYQQHPPFRPLFAVPASDSLF